MTQTVTTALTFEDALMACTDTLQSKYNAEEALDMLLQIIGEFYAASSSYIFEFDDDRLVFNNKYQWNSPLTQDTFPIFDHLPFSILDYFSSDFLETEDGCLLGFDANSMPHLNISITLKEFDIENVLIIPMVVQEKTTGFVAMANVTPEDFDARLLVCANLFIQECLDKRDMHLQLSLLHNLDPLTGFFNKSQYLKKLVDLEEKPPKSLGIVFIQLTGLEQTAEIYGSKYVDVKIKQASSVMSQFFDFPFYRVEDQKFLCFVLNAEETSFHSVIEQLRIETSVNSDACFTVGHTWCTGDVDIHEEVARSSNVLQQTAFDLDAPSSKQHKNPTECLLTDLEGAISQNEFMVYLQPKVVLATQEVIGAEALVRRKLIKTGGVVPPDKFVPLYEHHAIIRHLDLHVLEQVCTILSQWQKDATCLPISVNFSRVTLMEDGIAQVIADVCEKYKVPTQYIELEITERLGTSHNDMSELMIEDFQKLGLNLVLDDFGSTYSNFLTLTQVPISEVKIDQSLIKDVENSVKNHKILQSIVKMCAEIGNAPSLAEGVETATQRELLINLNCIYGQGFYFSHPLPHEEFYEKFIQK